VLRRRTAVLLALPVVLGLLGYVLLPLGQSIWLGLDGDALAVVFGRDGAGWRGLTNSVGVSVATVLLGGLLGTSLAWSLWRYRLPWSGGLRALAAVPLALPPLVGALAVWLLLGDGGILPRLAELAAGGGRVFPGLSGRGAVLAVHVYAFHVYYTLFVGAALTRLDGSLLDASADLGASSARTFGRVVLPTLRPALVGASLVVFMLSMGSFTAPLLFAGDEPFLTTQVYAFKTNNYLDRAAAISTVLAAVCVAFLLLAERRRPAVAVGGRPPRNATPPRSSVWTRVVVVALVVGVLAVLTLPVLTVVLLSFVEDGSWTTQLLPTSYTLSNYTAIVTDRAVFAPVASSLWMAGVATAAAVLFGLAVALVVVKSRLPGRGLVRLASLLPFALPGPVVALALLVWFGEPSWWAGGTVLVGTVGLLPLAYAVRHLPLAVRATQASLEGFDDRLAEASADLGATWFSTLRSVVLPAIRPGVVAGALLAFVSALGEFPASVLLYVFANRPIAVEVLSRMRAYDLGAAAAYAVLLMVLVGVSAAISWRAGERAEPPAA
jgi:iron(III) transport system permease protein